MTLRDEDDFKEGVMAFGDIGIGSPAYDVTALYISTRRIGERMSNFFMFGGSLGDGISNAGVYISQISGPGAGIILNNSFFYHFASSFVVGLEMNLYVDVGQRTGSYISFYPQFTLGLAESLTLQAGLGIVYNQTSFNPELVFRLVSGS